MSPASKSKSKDKKAGKEPIKGSPKPSVHVNISGVIPSSGYNPLLGTFHTFDTSPVPSTSQLHVNGRFRNIDDTDDHNGNGIEYDTVSNNDSWSGESEDHKEKTSQTASRQESVPGADNDKREKIRQKNEKKHQRQKERRAQELHEKCSGYLMSRKLEALAQQLVAMGFSQERATVALILNEGRVEESVSWLFESSEDDKNREHNIDGGGNLKIDISEELACISEMEIRYKVSKQEVERTVVACEGDLDKAEETLKEHKQEPPKQEETGDPLIPANGKLPIALNNQNATKVQVKSIPTTVMQQKRDERDFNYSKAPVTVMGPTLDPGEKNMQAMKKIPPKPEWTKQQQNITVQTDKRWTSPINASPINGQKVDITQSTGSNRSFSYSLTSPINASPPQTKPELRFIGNELKNLQLGSVREPVIVMQRPQSINTKQVPNSNIASSPPNWYSNGNVETLKPNGFVPPVSSNGVGLNPMYNQLHYQSQQFVSNSSAMDSQGGNGLWSRGGSTPTLAPASNLGLFSGLGANGSSGSNSPVDWSNGGSMLQLDYASIDWSLDLGSLVPKANGWWSNGSYTKQNKARTFDSFSYGLGLNSATRHVPSNGGPVLGLHGEVSVSEGTGGGSREWTSPFEEKDIFSLPRQFVSSPSL